MKKNHFPLCLAIVLLLASCNALKEKGSVDYISEVKTWQRDRIEGLNAENGWLNLVGLYWLKEDSNSFGSDPSNNIVFPKNTPAFMGSFILKNGQVTLSLLPNVTVASEGRIMTSSILKDDTNGKQTTISFGTLRWGIIKRGDKVGVRLRDTFAPLVKNFPGIELFPINEDWKIEAQFEPELNSKEIPVQNVLGQITPTKVVGSIQFKKEEKDYRLLAFEGGENSYFVTFKDKTNGKETYGAGRFLSVEKSQLGEPLFIDFNQAYNPPCAFTKFATCPLPPKENHLKIRVTAGEKTFAHSQEE